MTTKEEMLSKLRAMDKSSNEYREKKTDVLSEWMTGFTIEFAKEWNKLGKDSIEGDQVALLNRWDVKFRIVAQEVNEQQEEFLMPLTLFLGWNARVNQLISILIKKHFLILK